MVETILASYGCSYLLLGYLELMDELSSYVDKKTERHLEEERKAIDEIRKSLEQIDKQIKETEKMKINISLDKNKKIIKKNERHEFLKAEFAHILELDKKGKLKKLVVKYGEK